MNDEKINSHLPAAAAIPQPCEELPVPHVRKMIHYAILAERERCVKIAESVISGDYAGKGDEKIDKNHTMSRIISAWIVGKIKSGYSESPLSKYMREFGQRMDEAAKSDGSSFDGGRGKMETRHRDGKVTFE